MNSDAQSEQALRENEAHLAAIISQAATGISEVSPEGRFLRVNRALCALLQRSSEDLLGLNFADITHPDDIPRVLTDLQRLLDTGAPVSVDKRCLRADGTIVWTNNHLSRLQNGKTSTILAVTSDLTEAREAERRLRESNEKRTQEIIRASEERLRMLADALTQIVWTNAGDGRANYFNKRWEEYTGLSYDESAGRGWEAIIHAEDASASTVRWQRSLAKGEIFETEFRLRNASGSYRWFAGRNVPVRESDGAISGWFGTATDIHHLKEAEATARESQERLKLIVENARDYAIFSTDLERRVTSWNPGAEQLLGFSEQEILGQLADLIFTEEDRRQGIPSVEASKALAQGRASDERWHERKDGTRFWGSGLMMPMQNEAGVPIGLIKIFRDQTAEKQAQEALERSQADLWEALQENEQAREEAEVARKAKDHFLAVLSHELRTPLVPVVMAVKTLLRMEDLPPLVAEALQMIDRNIRMEVSFIDDLLDITRIEHGKMELQFEETDLHEVVRRAVEVSAADFEAKRQRLTVDLHASHSRLRGDATRLQQALWNLLKNASKFTPEAGEVHVASHNESASIVITISDSGIGFSPELAEIIFDSFHQANIAVTKEFGGLGLGLAIAKATIAGHGGQLRANSDGAGKGATFVVELPLTRDGVGAAGVE